MRRHLLAAMATVTIASAACSSAGAPQSTAVAGSATAASGNAAKNDEPDERLTPLSAFFTEGRGGEPTQEQRDQAASDFGRLEEIIADCMQQQGFRYVQREYGEAADAKLKKIDAFDLPPDQYAERWGYGISTIDASQYTAEAPDDPNAGIAEALSPEARDAYEKALYGDDKDNGEDESCQGRAMRDVYGEGFNRDKEAVSSEFTALDEEMGALWDRVVNDGRVVDAKRGWADCMADAGHPEATDPDDAARLVVEKFSELYGVDPGQFKEVRAGMTSAPRQPEPAAVAEVQNYERSLAVADRRCKAHYDDVVFTVQSEVENRFIEENRAELERYRDSMGLRDGIAGRKGRAVVAGGKG
ncbi:MAG TPA: hypothetical protein VEG38_23120 [Acidimicrobiia bacterium]|nr:hypothetical protein [Acidimicrobiia bacterium]